MKSIFSIFLILCFNIIQAQNQFLDEMPENPESGKCYVKQTTPDEFEFKTFRVVEVPAHKKLKVVPAIYKIMSDEVVVTPASKSYKFIPATYKTTIDTFWIEEPHNKIIAIDAVFADGYEEIELKSKATKWEVNEDSNCLSSNLEKDCRVYRFREIPAVVSKVPVKKLFVPARTIKKRVGGKHKLIKRKVLLTPARIEEVIIPEVKEIVERRVLVKDEYTQEIEVPASYKTLEKKVIAKKGSVFWKEVPCVSKSKK